MHGENAFSPSSNFCLYVMRVVTGKIKHGNTNLEYVGSYEMLQVTKGSVLYASTVWTNEVDGDLLLSYAYILFRAVCWYCVVTNL